MNTLRGTVKWGIIGAGDVCEKKSGPAFNKVPNSELVGVMRRNIEKARDYARRHNVPKFYDDAGSLLRDPEINAIYIATPPAFHEQYTLAALQAGKPVYVEKPVSLNQNSCLKMIQEQNKFKLPVSVAHYRRELPMFKKIKKIMHSGQLGKILLVTINTYQSPIENIIARSEDNWRINPELSGGGLFHDLAPHQLDLMCWYFGEPDRISGYSLNHGGNYKAPDFVCLNAIFRKDVNLSGVWAFSVHKNAVKEECEIIGEKGKLNFSFFRNPILYIHSEAGTEQVEFSVPENIQQPMIEQVVKFFRGEADNPCSLDDALASLKMMDATLGQ
jgi:predicted dehydrogenase